jgi:hypothetical protein
MKLDYKCNENRNNAVQEMPPKREASRSPSPCDDSDSDLFPLPHTDEARYVPAGFTRPPEGFLLNSAGDLVLLYGGRHHSISSQQQAPVNDLISFHSDVTPDMLLSEAIGLASRVKHDLLACRYMECFDQVQHSELRRAENAAQALNRARISLTRVVTSLLAIEYCLIERTTGLVGQVAEDRAEQFAQRRRSPRRRRV